MRKILIAGIVMVTSPIVFAQHSLEQLWQTDSVLLKNPESVLYDAKSNTLYVSNMGAGTVVRFGIDGKLIKSDWVTGLNSNKGSAIYNGLFYTAETSGIAIIDEKGSIVKRIPVEGAQMLNDVAIDSKGTIYVTDTRAAKLYKIDGDKPSIYQENLPGANGLLAVDKDLYVLTSTSVEKINASGQRMKLADGFESGLDGIVMVAPNEFVISNYKGMLYYLGADGTKTVLSDTRQNGPSANDISYDAKTKTVYVASYKTNRIIAYKVK